MKHLDLVTLSVACLFPALLSGKPAHAASAKDVYDLPDLADAQSNLLFYRGAFYGALSGSGNGSGQGAGQLIELKPKHKTPWPLITDYEYSSDCGTGCAPVGTLLPDGHGAFFGATLRGGTCRAGTIYQWHPASGVYTDIYDFKQVQTCDGMNIGDGGFPVAGPVLAPDGTLYGTTAFGGAFNSTCGNEGCGTIYHLVPPVGGQTQWTETVIYSFGNNNDGAFPGQLTMDSAGNLYGTAEYDAGPNQYAGNGSIFELSPPNSGNPSWTLTTLHQFAGGADGAQPLGTLLPTSGGAFYGITLNGGNATCDGTGPAGGLVFELTPPKRKAKTWTNNVLYSFGTNTIDGCSPSGGVTLAAGGILLGTTYSGGSNGYGAGMIYELTPPKAGSTWTESELFSPQQAQGQHFISGLVSSGRGKYVTTTQSDGAFSGGTVIELTLP